MQTPRALCRAASELTQHEIIPRSHLRVPARPGAEGDAGALGGWYGKVSRHGGPNTATRSEGVTAAATPNHHWAVGVMTGTGPGGDEKGFKPGRVPRVVWP